MHIPELLAATIQLPVLKWERYSTHRLTEESLSVKRPGGEGKRFSKNYAYTALNVVPTSTCAFAWKRPDKYSRSQLKQKTGHFPRMIWYVDQLLWQTGCNMYELTFYKESSIPETDSKEIAELRHYQRQYITPSQWIGFCQSVFDRRYLALRRTIHTRISITFLSVLFLNSRCRGNQNNNSWKLLYRPDFNPPCISQMHENLVKDRT